MAAPFSNAFQQVNLSPPGAINPTVGRGSLITFNYLYHKPGHDPAPLVLVTDVWNKYVRGVNLHYLTFPTIKKLVFPAPGQSICESPQFTYQYIKGNEYIVSAFRQYKREGIQQLKKLNCEFIVTALAVSRSFDPNEIEAIHKSVREQVWQLVNPQASATGEMPMNPTTPVTPPPTT
jgi:hypothetical protein